MSCHAIHVTGVTALLKLNLKNRVYAEGIIEGRDHTSGDSFIQRGNPGAWQEDLYLTGATIADHDFIAHAWQDGPLLLDEIERLQALLNRGEAGDK